MPSRFSSLIFATGAVFLYLGFQSRATDEGGKPADHPINAVGLEIYRVQAAQSPTQNLVLSPYSITWALRILSESVDDEVRAEMQRVLHLPDSKALQAKSRELDAAFRTKSRRQPFNGFTLKTANQLFVQEGTKLRKPFLDSLSRSFAMTPRRLNFAKSPDASRDVINAWIAKQTKGHIPAMLDSVAPETEVVLASALFLNAPWQEPFPEDATAPGSFTLLNGDAVQVPMMEVRTGDFRHAFRDGYQAAYLRYAEHEFGLYVLLPDAGMSLEELEKKLTPSLFSEIYAQALDEGRTPGPGFPEVLLRMPKFAVTDQKINLIAALSHLGVAIPTTFTRMFASAPNRARYVSSVHTCELSVDERGTIGAATADVSVAFGTHQGLVKMTVDRPFLFAVEHWSSSACLFIGRVTDPRSSDQQAITK